MSASTSKHKQSELSNQISVFSCKTVMERLRYVLAENEMTDVVILVGDEKKPINTHKFLLSIVSDVFRAMFYGSFRVMDEVLVPDIEPDIFQNMITFMYTGEIELDGNNIMKTVYAAKKYLVSSLETRCEEFLVNELSEDNVFLLLTHAKFFDLKNLLQKCWKFIDEETLSCLNSESFENIDYATLVEILTRNTLNICEINLYNAMKGWAIAQCRLLKLPVDKQNLRNVLKDCATMINYTLMDREEYASGPKVDRILTKRQRKEIEPIIKQLHPRAQCAPCTIS